MAAKLTRPGVLPITPVAPHLRGSAVLRMVHEEQGSLAMVAPQWPPQEAAGGGGVSQRGTHDFMAKCARAGGRSVEWPPRNEEGVAVRYGSNPALSSGQQQQQPGDSDGNLTTVYPSNFKLRSEMPVEQEASKVYQSQPAFKCTKPIRMRGDNKWPPTGAQQDTSEPEVREFIKPRKQCKDYSGFFAQNALPSNYTGYRAPPGTQHVGCEEDEGTSEM